MSLEAGTARKGVALLYGLLCHGCFTVGVGTMIVQMWFGMSRGLGRLDSPWSGLANAALLLQFPLLHSLFLTARGHRALARLAPAAVAADLLPSLYVMVAGLQTLLLFALWTPSGLVWWEARGPARLLLGSAYVASWLLLVKAFADAGAGLQTGAIGWWAVLRNRRPAYPGLPTGGLFRFSRQPIYLAFTCTLWTIPTWTPDQLAVAAVLSGYCLIGPRFKEARFSRMFGAEFEAYRRTHPYWWPRLRSAPRRNDLALYDRLAARWWDGSERWLRTLQNLVPARLSHFDGLTEWRGRRVLDLGCGGGFMSEALARRGARVTGVDPARRAVAIAAAHAAATGLDIRYLTARGEALPLPDGSMDAVVCVDVLEHLAELGAVLAEIRRVLKPGGLFLFDTINRTWLARLALIGVAEDLLRLLPRGTHDPAMFIRPEELRARLEALGFAVGPVAGLGPCGVNRRLDVVFRALPSVSIMYMGHARKPPAAEG